MINTKMEVDFQISTRILELNFQKNRVNFK